MTPKYFQKTPSHASSPKTFTLEEAAEFLKLSPAVLLEKTKEGAVPAFAAGSEWRYRKDDLSRFIEPCKKIQPGKELLSLDETAKLLRTDRNLLLAICKTPEARAAGIGGPWWFGRSKILNWFERQGQGKPRENPAESKAQAKVTRTYKRRKRIPRTHTKLKSQIPEGYVSTVEFARMHSLDYTDVRKAIQSGHIDTVTQVGRRTYLHPHAKILPDFFTADNRVTRHEFAKLRGLKLSVVHRLVRDHQIPGITRRGRRILIPRDAEIIPREQPR